MNEASFTTRKNGGGVVWHSSLRLLVEQVPKEQRERFQTEHLAEVASLVSADGLRLDVPMWFARGRVPEHVVSPVLRRGFE